jgi:hypothetical protein
MEIAGLGEVSSNFLNTWKSKGPSLCRTVGGAGSRNCFRSRTSPSTARAWTISSYVMTSAWTSFEAMWKNRGLTSKDIRVLFLSPITSIHVQKM